MDNNVKIIIADDHPLFREGLKLLIEMEEIGEVIAEAENGKELLDLLERLNPDLVLLDIEMPVMGGLEAARKAIVKMPGLKILVVTQSYGNETYIAMLNAGVKGFVLKTAGKQELEKAIKTVIKFES